MGGRDPWTGISGVSLQGAHDYCDYDAWLLLILSPRLSGPGKIQVMEGSENRRTDSLHSFHA